MRHRQFATFKTLNSPRTFDAPENVTTNNRPPRTFSSGYPLLSVYHAIASRISDAFNSCCKLRFLNLIFFFIFNICNIFSVIYKFFSGSSLHLLHLLLLLLLNYLVVLTLVKQSSPYSLVHVRRRRRRRPCSPGQHRRRFHRLDAVRCRRGLAGRRTTQPAGTSLTAAVIPAAAVTATAKVVLARTSTTMTTTSTVPATVPFERDDVCVEKKKDDRIESCVRPGYER